jgi:uncharacterized membrane protein YdjX (TVP38/TMEM64 family)
LKLRKEFFVAAGLLALAASLPAAGLREQVAAWMQPVQDLLRKAALDPTPGSLLLMVLILGVMPFSVVVPMTAGSVIAGALLPARVAPPVILAGMLLNTLLSWSIARTVFGRRLEAWIEKRGGALGHLRLAAKRSPFKWAFFSRFIPAPFVAAPMVLASAGVSLGYVLLATAVVMTPWSFAYAWAGRESREGSLGSLALAGLAAAALALLGTWVYRRFVAPAEAVDFRNQASQVRVSKVKGKPAAKRPRRAQGSKR